MPYFHRKVKLVFEITYERFGKIPDDVSVRTTIVADQADIPRI